MYLTTGVPYSYYRIPTGTKGSSERWADGPFHTLQAYASGVARAPPAPRPRGARGAEGARQGPAPGSNRRYPLARGPNKLFAGEGGPNR